MDKKAKIYIAGHRGLVGSAIMNNLTAKGYASIITRTHAELDLTDSTAVAAFFSQEKPDYVFLAAAKVGGIIANNTYRADFIYENLMIQNNVIHQSYLQGVKKLMFLGSTCIYPKAAPQPMSEDAMLTGPLEYTNEPYAISKIAGIKLCESYNIQYGTNYISAMPTNLYGPNDNFDLEKSHVLPALIRKIHLGKALENDNWADIRKDLDKRPIEGISGQADKTDILNILEKYGIRHLEITKNKGDITFNKDLSPVGNVQIEIWGTGKPMREFLWSEDMADACVFIMEKVDFEDLILTDGCVKKSAIRLTTNEIRNTHINIGTGEDISIKELAFLIKRIIGFKGEFYFNTMKPDGTLKKLTNISRLNDLGWKYKVTLPDGLKKIYDWFIYE